MGIQFSAAVRNAQLDSWATTIGASPKLRLYSGAMPANCATAASGTLLCEIALPATWMAAASAGSKAMAGGPWSGTGAAAAGAGTAAGYFRIYDSTGTTCHDQGTVTGTGSGGDMTLDNVSIANGQAVNINSFTRTAGNA